MNLEELTHQLWIAAEGKNQCRISLEGEPLPRIISPYGVCTTSRNQIVLVCWQTLGLTKAGSQEGYRNLQLDRIIEFEILDRHFQKRTDFNPQDSQYGDWVFHI